MYSHIFLLLLVLFLYLCWNGANPEGAFPWAAGVVSRVDPFESICFMLNGHHRFEHEAVFFRTVIPHQYHSSIPTIFAYNYCFCLFPEDDQRPSGSMNGSRIDCMNFNFKFTRNAEGSSAIVEDGSITIFARSFNVMKYDTQVSVPACTFHSYLSRFPFFISQDRRWPLRKALLLKLSARFQFNKKIRKQICLYVYQCVIIALYGFLQTTRAGIRVDVKKTTNFSQKATVITLASAAPVALF